MKRLAAATLAVAALLLTGCGSAASEDTRRAETVAYLTTTSKASSGEAVTAAYTDAGIFEGIANDLIELCGDGTQYLYASKIPDLEDAIVKAYDIACPK